MEQDDKRKINRSSNGGHIFSGLLLVGAGILLLASRMGAPIPGWVFSWHTLLIAIGLFIGFRSNFRNPGWVIMFAVGGFFLLDDVAPGYKFHDYILPAILITVGAFFIMRPKGEWKRDWEGKRHWRKWDGKDYGEHIKSNIVNAATPDFSTEEGEYIDVTAAFGGVKKLILSKNFKGGEMNCFMGGTEINLLQADIQQPIVLEVNAVFGGAKIIVPSNWNVKNEVTAVFGGVEDKRSINSAIPDERKSIALTGTCVFGGIEIKNF